MISSLSPGRLKDRPRLELYYDAAFLVSLLCCSLVGAFPQYSLLLSCGMVLCFGTSLFSDNFFLYAALFLFMRNKMVIGDTTAYRFYSYLLVLKCVWELPRLKIRVAYLPVLFVLAMHCVFAAGRYNLRMGLNVIVDVVLVYLILARVEQDDALTRRLLTAFLLGMVLSGVYGFTASDAFKDIHVTGAGAETVSRNFGALGDANYAGFFYDAAVLTALVVKGIPRWLRVFFVGLGLVLVVRTASLSALASLGLALCFLLILKMRRRAVPVLLCAGLAGAAGIALVMHVPFLGNLPGIHGLVLRLTEKLYYIRLGRWDMLTTDRAVLWAAAWSLFVSKGLAGRLLGGSVITYMIQETTLLSSYMACHQSYLQALLNFGILGTVGIYGPLLLLFLYRLANHFLRPAGYDREDIKIMQLVYAFLFFVFGFTIDFFIDWTFLFFCFF